MWVCGYMGMWVWIWECGNVRMIWIQIYDLSLIIIFNNPKLILYYQNPITTQITQMQLRTCDYRNSKYQGQTQNKQPSGFGLVLDENYTFVISSWANGTPVGPFAVIFDDSTKMYGDVDADGRDGKDGKDGDGIVVYCGREVRVFRRGAVFVVDFYVGKVMVRVDENSKSQSNTPTKYTQQTHLQTLSTLLNLPTLMPPKYTSYHQYIKQTFKQKYRSLLNILQSSKQFCLSLHQEGIIIKMGKKVQRIVGVGVTGVDRKYQIGRRYVDVGGEEGKWIVEEFVEGEEEVAVCLQFQQCYHSYYPPSMLKPNFSRPTPTTPPQQRPKQCLKSLRQYYKRSLSFLNKYLNLSKFYQQRTQFEQILKTAKWIENTNSSHSQTQLENNGYRFSGDQGHIVSGEDRGGRQEFTVEDWKRELGRTVANRHTRVGIRDKDRDRVVEDVGRDRRRSPERSAVFKEKENQMERQYTPNAKKDNNKYQKYNPQRQNSRPNRSKSKSQKQLKYLDSQSQHQSGQAPDPKYTKSTTSTHYKDTGSLYKNNERRSPICYKFKYFDTADNNDDPRIHQYYQQQQQQQKHNYSKY